MDEGWIDALALPKAQSRAYEQARASILLETMINARSAPESWISYSRRKSWYSSASGQRYRSTAYRFSTVPPAVDELEKLDLRDGRLRQLQHVAQLGDAQFVTLQQSE